MAAGLPVVAADVPVNRELCGEAALYFSPFDDTDCARQLAALMADADARARLSRQGLQRVERFQWSYHVEHLLRSFQPGPVLSPVLA